MQKHILEIVLIASMSYQDLSTLAYKEKADSVESKTTHTIHQEKEISRESSSSKDEMVILLFNLKHISHW